MSTLLEGLTNFANQLQLNHVPYAVIGGLAVFAYGGERTTFDVDFLVHSDHRSVVNQIGLSMQLRVMNENSEVLQFTGRVQIDVIFAHRHLAREMLRRTRTIAHFPFPVVSPEDLIGLKIQGFCGDRTREYRDKGDILTLMRNCQGLDENKIKDYADLFGVWNEIENIKKSV